MADEKPLTGEDRLRTAIKWLSTVDICYLKYKPYQKDQIEITIIGREQKASRNPDKSSKGEQDIKPLKPLGVSVKSGNGQNAGGPRNPESLSTECQTKALIATYEKKKVSL
jgi:hypothetical protein